MCDGTCTGTVDRRKKVDAGERTLTFDKKMELHVATVLMFASIGTLPATLFDNTAFIDWVHAVSQETYYPPNSRFMDSDGPVLTVVEEELTQALVAVILRAVEWYKGVAFMHLTFDTWTSRMGLPFIGANLTFLTPWLMSRTLASDPFTGESRFSMAMKLIHLEGRHTGERIARAVAKRLKEYGCPLSRKVLPADNYDEITDCSSWIASSVTDSGGGVPAAFRRLGVEHDKCNLHGLDTVLLWMFGLAQKHCPADLLPIKLLMKKVFALAAHFHRGDAVKRVAKHKKIQNALVSLKEAMDVLSSGLWDEAVQAQAEADGTSANAFLDVSVENPEELEGMERVSKHIVHGKTRCWSAVDSAASVFELRLANNAYVDEFADESHMNLTPHEHKDLQCILGVAFEITDVERYIEVRSASVIGCDRL